MAVKYILGVEFINREVIFFEKWFYFRKTILDYFKNPKENHIPARQGNDIEQYTNLHGLSN